MQRNIVRLKVGAMTIAVLATCVLAVGSAAAEVVVTVDNSKPRQVMEGFGATTFSLVHSGPLGDTLTPDLRQRAIEACYGQVKLNLGNLEIGFVRRHAAAPGSPKFDTFGSEAMKKGLIDPARPLGFADYMLSAKLRNGKPEDCAEQGGAVAVFWRDQFRISPRYLMPFNEPTSGNCEVGRGQTGTVVAILKALGKRLREVGFKDTLFVAPCEETVARSLEVARAILDDPDARAYLGAVGYHCYPYGSPYADVRNILKTSGQGKPVAGEIEVRGRLRDLAAKHGLATWMTEVSHGEAPALGFDLLRGRAIHIHDELVYADAAAFFAMNNLWDLATHRDHFKGRGGDAPDALYTEMDTVVLIDNEKATVHITGTGYAIGHYARWLRRGAVRLEAESADPLVQVTAFRDDGPKRLVLVVINNSQHAQTVRVDVKGLGLSGKVAGEQSTKKAFWKALEPRETTSASSFAVTLPPLSVTSLAAPLA